ncbi:MAG: hypothetical protein WEE20_03360 [Bacteroidota bacterium]
MKARRCKLIIVLCCWSMAAGCGPSSTNSSGETEKIADTYAGLMLLHEQYRLPDPGRDSVVYHRRVQSLLDSAGFTREEFSASVEQQLRTLESSRRFYERLHTALELLKSKPNILAQ